MGNCEEQSDIIRYELSQKGIKAECIRLNIVGNVTNMDPNKRKVNDHYFIVIGLKKGALHGSPSTWGNKAIIVDSWAGIVDNAHKVINYYKILFKFDPKKERLIFTNHDKKFI